MLKVTAYLSLGLLVIGCNRKQTSNLVNSSKTPSPFSESQELLQKAERGDAEAQFKLSERFEKGVGVPEDSHESLKWLESAAAQNQPDALNRLGLLYVSGVGVVEDRNKALELFKAAAEKEHLEAQFNYGQFQYLLATKGKTGDASEQEGVVWLRKAADRGHIEAMSLLGEALSYKYEKTYNPSESIKWLLLAQSSGDEDARKQLEKIRGSIPPDKLAEGQRLAKEWQEENKSLLNH